MADSYAARVGLVLTSCATGSTSPAAGNIGSSPAQLNYNPFSPPDSPYRIAYNDQLTSDLVDSNSSVTVTAEQAYRDVLDADGKDDYRRPGTPTETLRTVSVGYEGQGDSFKPHTAWVLTWSNGKAVVGGPASLSADERAKLESTYVCTVVVVVNAVTARVEGGEFYFCRSVGGHRVVQISTSRASS